MLKTHTTEDLVGFSTSGSGDPRPVHQQHANDAAEMILLHLNMNKAILSPASMCPCHTPTPSSPPTHFKLDILVLVNQILFSGGNPALYIADWIETQIGADLHSSCAPLCIIARNALAIAQSYLSKKQDCLFFV